MKIMAFVKSLLPRLDKDDVLEDITVTKTELKTGVLPSLASAKTCFKAMGIKSDQALALQKTFYTNFTVRGLKRQENLISEMAEAFPKVLANLEYIETQVEDLFNRDILREGLSARKAILLRSAEQISFLTRFSIDVLNLIYVYEARAKNTELIEGFEGSDRVREMVEKNIFIFALLLKTYSQSDEDFKKVIFELPDTVINSQTEATVISVYKEHELDPMSSAMVQGFEGNPIYHLRLIFAEWQANRYKNFSDKKRMLELRLLHLKMLNEDKSSPGLEKEIEYIQGRVEDLDYKLKKMEEA